jgi:acetoin utilization deacetylase AcuC-like enzyme
VHHGNGTDVIFVGEPRILVCSLFQKDLYPFSAGHGHTGAGVNVALPAFSSSDDMRHAVTDTWLPALDAFRPEFVFVSAGFDAHAQDDISDLRFSDADFNWLTELTLSVAAKHARGRLVSTLEGGYDLDSLARCAANHVKALAGV